MDNAVEFTSSEESDEGQRKETPGPPTRHVMPLEWERLKLKNIKAVQNILTPTKTVHSYNTTNQAKLNFYRPQVRSNIGKFTFKYSA